MIETLENGIRKITLGEGTTYISQVLPPNTEESAGILFSSNLPLPKDFKKRFNGDEVIIEILNFQGAMSYIKPIIELLRTWKIEGLEKEYDELLKTIDIIIKK